MAPWSQPLDPLHSIALSALAAALPLFLLLVLMGVLRKSGYVSAAWGLLASGVLATVVWRMPLGLALRSTAYGVVYGLWPIMWIVFAALWLYNLSVDTGKFDLLRRWMVEHASGGARTHVSLVARSGGGGAETHKRPAVRGTRPPRRPAPASGQRAQRPQETG